MIEQVLDLKHKGNAKASTIPIHTSPNNAKIAKELAFPM
jgi:hypothetical protein